MAKPLRPLPIDEAVRRTERITSLLAQDTWFALRARAAMDTANDIIAQEKFDRPSRFADTYNVVQNSVALTVSLAVARLFDVSDTNRYPVEQQDKTSIPVLANLLMRHDVQDALIDKAHGWHPQLINGTELGEFSCKGALTTALALYETHTKSTDHQEAYARLRKFRTSRLAHHLFDDLPTELPRFDDLDLLADFARDFVRATVLAVEGRDLDLGHQEEIKRGIDRQFWDAALLPLSTEGN
jgi:AbiU2